MNELIAYIGRENIAYLTLQQGGVIVAENAVTRAVFSFGDYCLDTDEDDDPILLTDSDTKVKLQLGLVEGLEVGIYIGQLTIWDAEMESGKAWGERILITVNEWNACEGDE